MTTAQHFAKEIDPELALATDIHRAVEAQRVEELVLLNEIGARVASTLELEAILAYVMGKVKEVFAVEACSLMLLDEEQDVLRFKLSCGTGAEQVTNLSFPADRGLAGWMVREKKPLLVDDVQNDARFYGQIDHNTGLVTRQMIGAPLMVKDRVIGVLEAINKREGAFDERDLRLLSSIATPVAQALENARLFDELNQAYADLVEREKRIADSRNMLRAIIDGIGDAVVIVDRGLHIAAANQAAAAAAETPAEDLIGRPYFEVWPSNMKFMCEECPVQRTLDTGKPAHRVCKSSTAASVRDWDVYTYPLRDRTSRAAQVVVLARDVTEERRLQASVARSAKLAAVGKLAAGTAHELSNPLTAILGNAALLQRLSPRDSSTHSLATTILEAAERARNILRSLLDYSRHDQYCFAATDINASLEWSLSLLKYAFDDQGIELRKELSRDLPPVTASESHLRMLWTNLLLNAVDAVKVMAKGSDGFHSAIQVSSELLEAERAVRVVVRDNGVGIPDAILPRMFEPFFTTKKPSEGTGLGLYTCHAIVEQHNGHIGVESGPGQGATFTITLPIER